MNSSTSNKMLERLSVEMRGLLDAELAAGNTIVESGIGPYGNEAPLILLAGPFRMRSVRLPAGIEYREINDPHWWKAEYFQPATKHCVACRF